MKRCAERPCKKEGLYFVGGQNGQGASYYGKDSYKYCLQHWAYNEGEPVDLIVEKIIDAIEDLVRQSAERKRLYGLGAFTSEGDDAYRYAISDAVRATKDVWREKE